ncbi:Lrp/AsnC family transcriptional regulator [Actinospica durhamensis]|uniref:Lrp/AsnC family transcriptional regulator n=1 Tax=Actinospica durhamensis TaxID=1508375 RepID=A0A941ET52_9ACTN|nr:Lrp/AsnC family transcriptional regulator [Actinospica durhamensis]MBR7836821.1 Lrp/AsnC family transcriptional regulator [Actinospica durhamensis]
METQPPDAEAGRSAAGLDQTDRAIIAELVRDGRIPVRTLAERVHISRANAYARIARLQAEGALQGFTARLDSAKAGLATIAYISLTIDQNAWRSVSDRLRMIPNIEHFALVGGDYDVLALVRTRDNSELRRIVLERIQDIPGVRSTRTWLVFEEVQGSGVDWTV